jgi:hypothetical protein
MGELLLALALLLKRNCDVPSGETAIRVLAVLAVEVAVVSVDELRIGVIGGWSRHWHAFWCLKKVSF